MSRLHAAFAVALMANPVLVACAHDPLDDKSGEEDFSAQKVEAVDSEGKPHTARTERQEADLKKEEDDLEQIQFKFNEERDALLADKQELKEVLSAQHQRDLVVGRRSNTGPPSPSSSPTPKADPAPADDSGGDSGGTTVTHRKKKSVETPPPSGSQ